MANEKRLIDANELVRFCENEMDKYENGLNEYERDYAKAICVVKKIARTFPTVDAVEVVRCKDCIHFKETNGKDSGKPCGYGSCMKPFFIQMIVDADDFCPYGERREGE